MHGNSGNFCLKRMRALRAGNVSRYVALQVVSSLPRLHDKGALSNINENET